MRVAEVMTKNVMSVGADESVGAAARLMWDCDCGAIPVTDERGRAIAMVTDRDICMAALFQDRPLSAIRVSEVMSRQLYYCNANDSLMSAEDLMRQKQIRRIPVLDDEERLVGFLSLADIARRGETSKGRPSSELAPDQIALTLANICQPSKSPQSSSARA